MIVGVPIESFPGERRVAVVPSVVPLLEKCGLDVVIERGAGTRAGHGDAAYEAHGVRILDDRAELFRTAQIIVQVRGLGANPEAGRADLSLTQPGQVLVSLLDPLGHPESARELAETGATSFALELLPRISRAQSMDVLSSMATVSGYKAVLMAANLVGKMWPLMMTAAGTVNPAKILVVGTGVAGLQAIATARRIGAVVQAYDVRPAARQQVESLGARFLELDLSTDEAEGAGGYAQEMGEEFYRLQREMMTKVVAECDAVITTAAVPGRKAPILVTGEMVRGMRPGSVIIDLAAEGGGNCELTRLGESVVIDGVTVVGPLNLPASIPADASQMYSRNVLAFLKNLVDGGAIDLDKDDPILRESLLTRDGAVVHERVRAILD